MPPLPNSLRLIGVVLVVATLVALVLDAALWFIDTPTLGVSAPLAAGLLWAAGARTPRGAGVRSAAVVFGLPALLFVVAAVAYAIASLGEASVGVMYSAGLDAGGSIWLLGLLLVAALGPVARAAAVDAFTAQRRGLLAFAFALLALGELFQGVPLSAAMSASAGVWLDRALAARSPGPTSAAGPATAPAPA